MRGAIPPNTIPRTLSQCSSSRYTTTGLTYSQIETDHSSTTGRHHHHLLSTPPFSSLQDQTTTSHSRSHRRHTPRSFDYGSHPRLYRRYLPCSFNAYTVTSRERGLDIVPLLGWARGGLTAHVTKLENRIECRRGRNDASIRFWVCYRIRPLSSVPYGTWYCTYQLRNVHAFHWCGDGYHSESEHSRTYEMELTRLRHSQYFVGS